jgi:hypothetical protein
MLRIFNTKALTQNERFTKAIIIGIISALALSFLYGLLTRLIGVQFSILYIAIGFGLSRIIRNQGRGVQIKFSYLGAMLTLLAIFLGDIFAYTGLLAFQSLNNFIEISLLVIRLWLSVSINNLLGLLFRIYAIYYAFMNSRIV